jgi:hypothetical protein
MQDSPTTTHLADASGRRDTDDLFLNNSITHAEDKCTILAKDDNSNTNVWQSTLPTSSVAQQALVLPNVAAMPPTIWN